MLHIIYLLSNKIGTFISESNSPSRILMKLTPSLFDLSQYVDTPYYLLYQIRQYDSYHSKMQSGYKWGVQVIKFFRRVLFVIVVSHT